MEKCRPLKLQLLFLYQRDLVLTDFGGIYAIGKSKAGIQPKLRILGLKIFFNEELQNKARHFNTVD